MPSVSLACTRAYTVTRRTCADHTAALLTSYSTSVDYPFPHRILWQRDSSSSLSSSIWHCSLHRAFDWLHTSSAAPCSLVRFFQRHPFVPYQTHIIICQTKPLSVWPWRFFSRCCLCRVTPSHPTTQHRVLLIMSNEKLYWNTLFNRERSTKRQSQNNAVSFIFLSWLWLLG